MRTLPAYIYTAEPRSRGQSPSPEKTNNVQERPTTPAELHNPTVSGRTCGASALAKGGVPSITDGLIDRGGQTKTGGSMVGVPIWTPLCHSEKADCEEPELGF